MNDSITIRRSPIILIRNFITIEIIAFLLYLLGTGHGDYKYAIYSRLFISKLFSYEVTKLILLSVAQLLITIYVFLNWYYKTYKIQPGVISYSYGVFFKKKKTFPLDKSLIVKLTSGPLGKMFHYGSVNLEKQNNKSIVLTAISYPQNYLETIKKAINPEIQLFVKKPNIEQLINREENENLEFKSSLRFDHRTGGLNRDLEKATMKSVAAFLNSKGGYLVIGTDDSRQPLGLSYDYQTIQRKDSDGFENHFTQVFNSMIGPEFRHLVKLWFYKIGERDICVIEVALSPNPVYLRLNESEHFYIRTGNIITDLKFSEVESYKHSRWSQHQI
jgi:membrane protein YdbS with pleckstrin-like domain